MRNAARLDKIERRLRFIERVLIYLYREEHNMAITQEQFDQDLGVLISALDELIVAVDAIASKPAADLTTEEQAVLDATQRVKDELAKITPAPAEEPPAEPTA